MQICGCTPFCVFFIFDITSHSSVYSVDFQHAWAVSDQFYLICLFIEELTMAKFQGKPKGGSSKIEKVGDAGITKPSNKRQKILEKKAKYTSKKFKGSKPLSENKEESNVDIVKDEKSPAKDFKKKPTPQKSPAKDFKKKPTTQKPTPKKTPESKDLKRKQPAPKTSDADAKKEKKDHRDQETKDLMAIYEKLRRKNTSKEDRHKLIDDVLKYSSDKKEQIVFKHDTVRVLEHCVKYGDVKQREQLFDLFKVLYFCPLCKIGY